MPINTSTVMVIGGSGHLGGQVVQQLRSTGVNVIAVSRNGKTLGLGEKILRADFLSPEGQSEIARAAREADCVIQAAEPYTWPSGISARDLARRSRSFYKNLARVLEGGQRIVRISTPVGRIPSTEQFQAIPASERPPYPEWAISQCPPVSPKASKTPYFRVKEILDQSALFAKHDLGLPIVTATPTAITGPGSMHSAKLEIPLRVLLAPLLPLPQLPCNAVHISDVARGIILAAEKGQIGKIYQLGGVDIDLDELMNLYADAAGLPRHLSLPFNNPGLQQFILGGLLFSEIVLGKNIPWWLQSTPWAVGITCGNRSSDLARYELGYIPTNEEGLLEAILGKVEEYRSQRMLG